jgi:hypothetical protein
MRLLSSEIYKRCIWPAGRIALSKHVIQHSLRLSIPNQTVNDRFNNFNIGEDQGNYPTDTIVFFGCIEYRPPNRQCFGTDMRCYVYVLLKFTVPTKCWLLEQVTSGRTLLDLYDARSLQLQVTSSRRQIILNMQLYTRRSPTIYKHSIEKRDNRSKNFWSPSENLADLQQFVKNYH